MKDLNVLKQLFVFCSLSVILLMADELDDILSHNKNLMFMYDLKHNELESNKLLTSWVKPVILGYNKNITTQFESTGKIDTYTVSIDQPIFRSGGIYYGMKYAVAHKKTNKAEIVLQKRKMAGDAVSILLQLKKNKLLQEKKTYQIDSNKINIHQKREKYKAGLLDSSFLDQSILEKSQNETSLLELKLQQEELLQHFSLLSDKNPMALKLPKLKLISKEYYQNTNLRLQKEQAFAEEVNYQSKITFTKYMPKISLQGKYSKGDLPLIYSSFGRSDLSIKQTYYNYGITISMPIDMNSFSDIEASKVAKLRTKIQVADLKIAINKEYERIRNSLKILDRKIALAKKDEEVYQNLYRLTQNLVKVGEKTSQDIDIMHNSLRIRQVDQEIYKIDKQIQLLKLYARVENVF
ncbi:MAG: TolC family protein [Sulfurovum sp.]|nr:TolC family protein [Sulfurovum sp.]MCB4783793.1 TolC family protein [Sulfurovum sp.]